MKINYFDKNFQNHYLEQTHELYQEILESFRESVQSPDNYDTILSKEFQDFFKKAIHSDELDKFNTQNWYWFSLIQDLVHLISMHGDLEISDSLELSPTEDELFNFWHDSDYAKIFLIELNETKDLAKTSLTFKSHIESQIISFFYIHIDSSLENITKIQYNIIPEIGDSETRIYSLKGLKYSEIDQIDGILYDGELNKLNFNKENLKNSFIEINSSSPEIDNELTNISQRVEDAIKIIHKLSPPLFEVLSRFTRVIVPINEKGVVSYSMQSLPYFSSINMYDRDFTDLLDDLLHENGHHYMNFILNAEELIYEDDEKIYYSPWRKALRPVRGIYHAYFTFYWAFRLFHDLFEHIDDVDFPISISKPKVISRLLEESLMLDIVWDEIMKAKEHGKVSESGLEIIQPIKDEIDVFISTKKSVALKKLKSNFSSEYNEYLEFEKIITQKEFLN